MNEPVDFLDGVQSVEAHSRPHSVQLAAHKEPGELHALFVLNSLNIGGSETKTVRLVNGLLARGIRAGIAYLNEPRRLLESLNPDVPIWHLGRRGKFSAGALRRLRALVRSLQPNCVFSVNLYPALYVSLASGLRRRPGTFALLNTTALQDGEQWRRAFYRPFLQRMDGLVFGCGLQRVEWQPYLRTEEERCSVIYNGVDTEHFAPLSSAQAAATRAELGMPANAFIVGTVGRLAPEKNQAVLLDALAELRRRSVDAHLLLVGDGHKRAELEQRAAQLQLQPNVTFAGVRSDVRPLLSCMDVFVLPSTHVETFSNAALEAMSMSKPIVLSRVGGAMEMIRDDVDGYTLPVAALQTDLPLLLMRLYADRHLRERLGRAARERADSCFSARSMIEEFAALIAKY